MEPDVATVASAVVPYVSAAVAAYGSAVVDRIEDAAADATVGLGGRLLRRLLGRPESATVEAAVIDLADDPADDDRLAALRLQIRKILATDQELLTDLAALVGQGGVTVEASGERSIAAQTISGVAVTGDDARITR